MDLSLPFNLGNGTGTTWAMPVGAKLYTAAYAQPTATPGQPMVIILR
jgi:hypothetical protein